MPYFHQDWAQMIEIVNNLVSEYRKKPNDEIILKIREICYPIEESYKAKLPEYLRDDFESIYLEKLWILIDRVYDISKCTFFSLLKKIANNDYIRLKSKDDSSVLCGDILSFDSQTEYEIYRTEYLYCNIYVQNPEDIILSKYDSPDYIDKLTPTERKVYEACKNNIVRTSRPDRFNLFHISVKDVAKELNYNRTHTVTVYLSSIRRKIRKELENIV